MNSLYVLLHMLRDKCCFRLANYVGFGCQVQLIEQFLVVFDVHVVSHLQKITIMTEVQLSYIDNVFW